MYEQGQVLEGSNRVIGLKVSDLNEGQLKLWYQVSFKYDGKARVVEQNTDPQLGSSDDYSPIPGKLVVQYDDRRKANRNSTTPKASLFSTHALLSIGMEFPRNLACSTHRVRREPDRSCWSIPIHTHSAIDPARLSGK